MAKEQLKPTSGAERRRKKYFMFKASEDLTLKLRHVDMTTMVFNNLIPFPLLKAAQQFEKFQKGRAEEVLERARLAGTGEAEFVDQKKEQGLDDIDPVLMQQWVEFLKHYACVVAVEPKIVMHETDREDELWVEDLSGDELTEILGAEPKEEGALEVTIEQAEEFRGPEQPPASDDGPDGPTLRPETKLVDSPEREWISA